MALRNQEELSVIDRRGGHSRSYVPLPIQLVHACNQAGECWVHMFHGTDFWRDIWAHEVEFIVLTGKDRMTANIMGFYKSIAG